MDGGLKLLVESVIGVLGGGECRRVGADEGDGPVSGVKAQGEESLISLVARLDHRALWSPQGPSPARKR